MARNQAMTRRRPGRRTARAANIVCVGARCPAGSALYQHVHDHLVYGRWSPQQIAARLHCRHPDDAGQRVSHETIYAAIYAHPRGGLKQAMIEALHQEKPAHSRRRTSMARTGCVPEELRIVHRTEEIELRQWPEHSEGDLIKGIFQSFLLEHAGGPQDSLRGAVPHGRLHGLGCAASRASSCPTAWTFQRSRRSNPTTSLNFSMAGPVKP